MSTNTIALNMDNRIFFVVSCARSGSTSLASILNEASNGRCLVEPQPNLQRESRDLMDGRLLDPRAALRQKLFPRVLSQASQTEVYGEKDLTYGPFLRHIREELRCRFVFLRRDGRDVVRSLLDWHDKKFGTIYRECRQPGELTPLAREAAARLPVHLDTSDYLRPRPRPHEPLYEEWEDLSRFEMCAYYWSKINELYLDELEKLPAHCWTTLDYTRPAAADILRVADFLGLRGLREGRIEGLLGRRINSLADRRVVSNAQFPAWRQWPAELLGKFDRLAAATMRRLGYYPRQGPGTLAPLSTGACA
jgi:hypothetical protein